MRTLLWRLTFPIVGLLALTVATAGPIVAQNIVVLHGLNAGLAKPLTVTAGGNLNVTGVGPVDATYITQTANATLTAEQALGVLATGILSSTTVTGVVASNSTSASIAALLSDETGTGLMVFSADPSLTGQVRYADGTAAVPSVTFTGDLDTGLFRVGSGHMAITLDGAAGVSFAFDGVRRFFRLPSSGVMGWSSSIDPTAAGNDTGFARNAAGVVEINNGTPGTFQDLKLRGLYITNLAAVSTAPTISSGFGTTPSITANNGTLGFTVNVGTGGTATGGIIGLPVATTGWVCSVENRTAVAANRADQRTVQTATSTTTATVQNQTVSTGAALAFTASDILSLSCTGI